MTDFIVRTMQLLQQPAAVFEHPSMQFVASNAQASIAADLVLQHHPGPRSPAQIFEAVGVDVDKALRLIDERGYYATEAEEGLVFATKLATKVGLTRPDLVLVTMHPRTRRDDALMAHYRMLMMLKVNEDGDRAIRVLENVMPQIDAALSAVHGILEECNNTAQEFNRLTTENLPEGS